MEEKEPIVVELVEVTVDGETFLIDKESAEKIKDLRVPIDGVTE